MNNDLHCNYIKLHTKNRLHKINQLRQKYDYVNLQLFHVIHFRDKEKL